jgi:hypothetical protein
VHSLVFKVFLYNKYSARTWNTLNLRSRYHPPEATKDPSIEWLRFTLYDTEIPGQGKGYLPRSIQTGHVIIQTTHSINTGEFYLEVKAARAWRWRLTPSTDKVKNEWGYTSTLPFLFMVCTHTNLWHTHIKKSNFHTSIGTNSRRDINRHKVMYSSWDICIWRATVNIRITKSS